MTFEDSGTGRELKKPIPEIREREGNGKKSIPEIREREGNGKNPFPKFGNGKGMKKNPFPKFGNGKGMKKSIPEIREGNQRPPFLGMTGNGNSRSPLTVIPGSYYENYEQGLSVLALQSLLPGKQQSSHIIATRSRRIIHR